MSSEISTDAYLDALADFRKIDAEVKTLGETLMNAGRALQNNPGRFVFPNIEPGLPIPAGLTQGVFTASARNWKTAEEIQTMLAEWHNASVAMTKAHAKLPSARQAGVQPPPRTT